MESLAPDQSAKPKPQRKRAAPKVQQAETTSAPAAGTGSKRKAASPPVGADVLPKPKPPRQRKAAAQSSAKADAASMGAATPMEPAQPVSGGDQAAEQPQAKPRQRRKGAGETSADPAEQLPKEPSKPKGRGKKAAAVPAAGSAVEEPSSGIGTATDVVKNEPKKKPASKKKAVEPPAADSAELQKPPKARTRGKAAVASTTEQAAGDESSGGMQAESGAAKTKPKPKGKAASKKKADEPSTDPTGVPEPPKPKGRGKAKAAVVPATERVEEPSLGRETQVEASAAKPKPKGKAPSKKVEKLPVISEAVAAEEEAPKDTAASGGAEKHETMVSWEKNHLAQAPDQAAVGPVLQISEGGAPATSSSLLQNGTVPSPKPSASAGIESISVDVVKKPPAVDPLKSRPLKFVGRSKADVQRGWEPPAFHIKKRSKVVKAFSDESRSWCADCSMAARQTCAGHKLMSVGAARARVEAALLEAQRALGRLHALERREGLRLACTAEMEGHGRHKFVLTLSACRVALTAEERQTICDFLSDLTLFPEDAHLAADYIDFYEDDQEKRAAILAAAAPVWAKLPNRASRIVLQPGAVLVMGEEDDLEESGSSKGAFRPPPLATMAARKCASIVPMRAPIPEETSEDEEEESVDEEEDEEDSLDEEESLGEEESEISSSASLTLSSSSSLSSSGDVKGNGEGAAGASPCDPSDEDGPAFRIYYSDEVKRNQARGAKVLGYITGNLKFFEGAKPEEGPYGRRFRGRSMHLCGASFIDE